jgi:alpha-N-arabinofuranosidase
MGTKQTKNFVSVILATAFICAAIAWAESENLIKNPSFADSSGSDPALWRQQRWNGNAEFEYSSQGRKDSSSVMITSEGGADAAWSQQVSVKTSARYRLSGWIKTQGLELKDGRGAQLNVHELQSVRTKAVTGDSDWTKVECEFETGFENSLQINCLFGGWGRATGKVWFDDIELVMLEKIERVSKNLTAAVTIDTAKTFEPISPYIYGQFIEHLGRCIYGGIWAEMLEDRKFYYPVPAKGDVWRTTGSGAHVLNDSPWKVRGSLQRTVKMSKEMAYSGKHSPQIKVIAKSPQGIYQEELGLVKDKKYSGYIVLACDQKDTEVEVALSWDGNPQRVVLPELDEEFKKFPFTFKSGADTDNGRLEILVFGKGTVTIGAVSLMPADNIKGFRADTLKLLKELNAPVYRWPGGNFVSGYDWRDGLGDRDKRPTRTNPAWTGIETNDVGIDEFIELCRLIDTEPMIAVNTGFGDAYSAAAQVEYCNGPPDTLMGKRRAQNGHRVPFHVKWWCIGNEMFGSWQLGYMSLNHYVLKHNQVEEKMRQVNPTIKTIGVGNVGDWSRGMLTNCADNMDLLSEHFYCQHRGGLVEHVRQIPNQVKRIADAHRQYRKTIPSLKDKDIRVALDEWNYWYGPHVFGELGTRYFMKDGLGIAAGLHEYFRNSDIMFMANYAQTVNVIGCIKTTKTAAAFETTGLVLKLYRDEYGSVPVDVKGDYDPLDIAAAWTDDHNSLTIGVVNPTIDSYSITLDIEGAESGGDGQYWQIHNENPMAYNDPGKEPEVIICQEQLHEPAENLNVPPISVTLYKLDMK